MVPDPSSISRRQLLGGLAGGATLGSGALVATGVTRPTALPNVLTDWATNYYPTPPAPSSLWQPTVTEAHAREAVELLAETEDEALERWDDIEDDDGRFVTGSGGWLSSAEESLEDGEYEDALSRARYGMRFAGEDLGRVRAEHGEEDLEALAGRADALLERVDTVVDDIEGRPVADPERDLAWYVHVESELQRGRHLAQFRGLEEIHDDDSDPPNYDSRNIGEITSELLRAEIAVETGEQYRDRLWELFDSTEAPYDDHLRGLLEEFGTELEPMPTRDEVEDEYIGDPEEYGPYEFAHSRLAQWCFPTSFSPPWRRDIDEEFLVLEVLALARGLVDWRAHEYAVAQLEVEPDDEAFDPGHILAEKRRGKSTYDDVIGSDPAPFMVVLSEEGIGNLRIADVRRDSWDDRWRPWNERIQAYLNALLGRARLQEYPAPYKAITNKR
ncbi:hypothetical protein [Natronobacterium texcoconense]|uniref:Uncharacterized protein n=1 Tax=Natronobacterium texcoconense TaxID=1095778 RepID=A0A1H1IYB6_NATTX|nr:hypothetical protein [Natronobacterium texcoconense]SDR42550.1 hypothetical protein SAMN04489842_3905 [Natronobacterium texcoconense]